MRKGKLWGLGALIVIVVYFFFGSPAEKKDADPRDNESDASPVVITEPASGEPEEGTYAVMRVVDGDTIVIDYNGTEERVRMIGVDTPESVHPDEDRNSDYGDIASAYTKEQLTGKTVSLEFDVEPRDQYSRMLAYVYVDGAMYNAQLVATGNAMVYTYPPNVKYSETFLALQQQAREAKLGLWEHFMDSGNYVASVNGSKYHQRGGECERSIKEKNKVTFTSPQAAEDAGYEPCSKCIFL